MTLESGGLAAAIAMASVRARANGALLPIATRDELLPEEGLDFVLRIVAGLRRKDDVDAPAPDAEPPANPFLAPEPALRVGELGAGHRVLLNKFPVMDGHALLVTRVFAEQESALDRADFGAIAAALQQTAGLAFYNAGPVAGASQRHKHVQLLPWPLASLDFAKPFDPAGWPGAAFTRRDQPYAHAWAPLDAATLAAPAHLAERYEALLAALGLGARGGYSAYNLLLTRHWMLAVRRRQGSHEGLAVNALGFAGTLLLRSEEQLALLRRLGPLALLRAVST